MKIGVTSIFGLIEDGTLDPARNPLVWEVMLRLSNGDDVCTRNIAVDRGKFVARDEAADNQWHLIPFEAIAAVRVEVDKAECAKARVDPPTLANVLIHTKRRK